MASVEMVRERGYGSGSKSTKCTDSLMDTDPPRDTGIEAGPDLSLADGLCRLLQGQALNARCRYLSGSDAVELDDYVERALRVVRSRYGADESDSMAGLFLEKVAGMPCGEDSRRLTLDALAAGRLAREGPMPVPEDLQRRIDAYCRLASAYYVELAHRHLAYRDRLAFWRLIAGLHNSLAERTLLGVSEAKHRAERAPKDNPVRGWKTRSLVRSAFRDIKALGPALDR